MKLAHNSVMGNYFLFLFNFIISKFKYRNVFLNSMVVKNLEKLKGIKIISNFLLIISVLMIAVSIMRTEMNISTILLVLGIILFFIWFLTYFSIGEKINNQIKKKRGK